MKQQEGFTLIETTLYIGISSLVIFAIIPNAEYMVKAAQDISIRLNELESINMIFKVYEYDPDICQEMNDYSNLNIKSCKNTYDIDKDGIDFRNLRLVAGDEDYSYNYYQP